MLKKLKRAALVSITVTMLAAVVPSSAVAKEGPSAPDESLLGDLTWLLLGPSDRAPDFFPPFLPLDLSDGFARHDRFGVQGQVYCRTGYTSEPANDPAPFSP